ncbi:MAG: DUF350 domain-containing protein [Elusimicrobiales bacterium]|nr:DUF350 domain-containing protein [Elusimicrobiales bacterium]
MYLIKVAAGLFELALMAVMSAVVIYITYRVFVKANPDFNMEEEIEKGNVAVGVLMGGILVSASIMLQRGLAAAVTMFRMQLSSQPDAFPVWKGALYILGDMALSLSAAVFTISFTLRLFGKMTRRVHPEMRLGAELQRGNAAVGILLAAAVLIAGLYVGEGVSALTKALLPQPSIGRIQIMR